MSGLLLQHFLGTEEGKAVITGRRCVELGTGTGAVSIAATRLAASSVLATDGNPLMEALASYNAHRNLAQQGLMGRFSTAVYRWGGPIPSELDHWDDTVDTTILLTDLLYVQPATTFAARDCTRSSWDEYILRQYSI